MKRLFVVAALIASTILFARTSRASEPVYTNALVNETALAFSTNVVLDLGLYRIDMLAMQAVYSSATVAPVTFTDGRPSTATITVVSTTNLASSFATDTITVSSNSALSAAAASDYLFVSSNIALVPGTYFTLNGVQLTYPGDWTKLDVASNTANSIKTAINTRVGGYVATTATNGSTVTITLAQLGTAGNAYTLTSSTQAALTAGTAVFTGGRNNATLTYNGLISTANIDWTVADVASNTAVNLKSYFNTSGSSGVTASTTASTVVTLTATTAGAAPNAYTLVSSTPAALAVGGATFSGGASPAYITINGTTLTESTDWTKQSTTTGTAKAISDAIMANATLNTIIASTWTSAGLVKATATAVGVNAYTLYTSTPALSRSSSTFLNGAASNIVTATSRINVASHGLTTGLQVLYANSAGTSPGQLVTGTTYYAVKIDANNVSLATTSAFAQAGTPIVAITTQTTLGGGSFTLTPLAWTGTSGFSWQSSNDNVNFFDLTTASVTFSSSTAAGSTTMWDGDINYRYLRWKFTGPTTGGAAVTVTGYGKRR